jgi:meso-butanediol dehydrogenase/(S,S)-butanediol dehydrogenase/diacetyl reductase
VYPELSGKVAIITGAGRRGGLGAAMAQRLAAEGAQVVITDLAVTDEMQAVLADIHAAGGRATGLACNMLCFIGVRSLIFSPIPRLTLSRAAPQQG